MKSVGTLQVTGVDFVVLPTSDFEAAIAFYDNTLGLRRSVYLPERKYAEFAPLSL